MKIIRWKFVIPVAIVVAVFVVFFVLFFDPLLTKGIEHFGSNANGAKVDVTGLHTKIFQGRIQIVRLQITNKEEPMKNMLDAGPLAFQVELSDLFTKRVIIPEASLEGLKFNTDRKTSGALPKLIPRKEDPAEKSAASKLADKYENQFKLNLKDMKFDAKEKITFDPKDTQVYKQGEALKTKAAGLPSQWKSNVDQLHVDERLKAIDATLHEVKNTNVSGVDAIKTIPEGLRKLKQAKDNLTALEADVKKTKDNASTELKNFKTDIASLQDAKKKDVDDLLSRLNLDFLNPKRLVDGFVGPLVLDRVKTALHYVQLVREHMPSKKEAESLPPKPRAKGMDILFWTPAAPPRFWLKKSSLSGEFQSISAAGMLTDLTTDPSRVGAPTLLNLKGNQGARQFAGDIKIDHVTDVKNDGFQFSLTGLNVKDMASGGQVNGAVESGQGQAEFGFTAVGDEQIRGKIKLNMSQLKLNRVSLAGTAGLPSTLGANASREDQVKFTLLSNVADAVEKMPAVTVETLISGTWADPDMRIDSNLDEEIKKAIKKSVGAVVDDQKKELEAKLDAVVKEKTGALNSQLAALQSKFNVDLSSNDSKIQEKIKEATGINLSSHGSGSSPLPNIKIPSLDKLFKK